MLPINGNGSSFFSYSYEGCADPQSKWMWQSCAMATCVLSGVTLLTFPQSQAHCSGWHGVERPWAGLERTQLSQASMLTLVALLLLGQHFHHLWPLPEHFLCQPVFVKPAWNSAASPCLEPSKNYSRILPCISMVLSAFVDGRGLVSI